MKLFIFFRHRILSFFTVQQNMINETLSKMFQTTMTKVLYQSAVAASTKQCYDRKCVIIQATEDVYISDKSITQIVTAEPWAIPYGYVIEIQPHACGKNWYIATNFLFPSNVGTLCIPILASIPVKLKIGQTICHIQIQTIKSSIQRIRGIKTAFYSIQFFHLEIIASPPPPSPPPSLSQNIYFFLIPEINCQSESTKEGRKGGGGDSQFLSATAKFWSFLYFLVFFQQMVITFSAQTARETYSFHHPRMMNTVKMVTMNPAMKHRKIPHLLTPIVMLASRYPSACLKNINN